MKEARVPKENLWITGTRFNSAGEGEQLNKTGDMTEGKGGGMLNRGNKSHFYQEQTRENKYMEV